MDKIKQEHIIAGVIGGAFTLALHAVLIKVAPGLFGLPPQVCATKARAIVHTMNSTRLPPAIGPYSSGKLIDFYGAKLAYSSG
jgi:hypothetical protein